MASVSRFHPSIMPARLRVTVSPGIARIIINIWKFQRANRGTTLVGAYNRAASLQAKVAFCRIDIQRVFAGSGLTLLTAGSSAVTSGTQALGRMEFRRG